MLLRRRLCTAGLLRSWTARSASSSSTSHPGPTTVRPPSATPSRRSALPLSSPTVPLGLGGSGRQPSQLPSGMHGRGDSDTKDLNPRQLSAHLDNYVVGQEKAKKVLAVAVYNHYTRLRYLQSLQPAPPSDSDGDPFSSTFREDPRTTISSARITPTAREGASTPSSEPSDFFTSGSLFPGRTKKPNPNPGEPRDPTLYNSPLDQPSHRLPPTSKNRQPLPPHIGLDDADLLTDFHGQASGAPLPKRKRAPPPPAVLDPDALIHEKSNVLLLGPTGSGKSLLAKTLARCLDVPFVGVEATGMTSAGYIGEDVENCVHRLLAAADWDVDRASHGIIFIDEIDKISRSSSASFAKDVSGEGVQQALLKILEGTVVSVPAGAEGKISSKGGPPKDFMLVDTTNILFVLSGAFVGLEKMVQSRIDRGSIGFNARLSTPKKDFFTPTVGADSTLDLVEPQDLVKFGFIPEFIGRLPVIGTLRALTEEDLVRVLTEPRNALVKQYEHLFSVSGVELKITTPALRQVAALAVTKGTGARGLRKILEDVLLESMYSAPGSSIKCVLVDREVVLGTKPANFYSRGQRHLFAADFAAEEGSPLAEEVAEEVEEILHDKKKRARAAA